VATLLPLMRVEETMKLSRYGSRAVRAASVPKETVTMIDRELQGVIAKLNSAPGGGSQREELLSQIHELKKRRRKAIQPRTFRRMLASLG